MSLVSVAVKRPVTIAMFTVAVVLFGMVSLSRLAVTLLPDLSYPTLTVRTDYPGAAPAEIEQLINRPIEESLGTVRGISDITSIARAGQSDVVLQFAWGTDMDMAGLDVREKLDMVQLPLDAPSPIILRLNPAMDPIMRLALSLPPAQQENASNEQLRALRTFADEDLKRLLESTPGVASVRFGGGLEDEIQVQVDQAAMARLDIDMNTLVRRLREENLNQAGGRVETERYDYLVRTLNQFRSLEEIESLYIASRNGRLIQLNDIASVSAGAKDRTSITRLNGIESVEVSLYKEGDANTVAVASSVRQRLDLINQELPRGYQLTLVSDQSTFIESAVSEVKNNALVGGLLAMLVIYFFLQRLWPTIIVSLAIPVSVIAAFMLMHAASVSLNIMSLGGIALAVGLLVDNAIVVLENIARRREAGDSVELAAHQGTREVSAAITASTLTTLAVFVPLIFVIGLAGQLFRDQALTVTFALAASLLVALTLIPMLASRQPGNAGTADFSDPASLKRPRGWRWLPYLLLTLPWRLFSFWLPVYVIAGLRFIGRGLTALSKTLVKPLLAAFDYLFNAFSSSYQSVLQSSLNRPKSIAALIVLVAGLCLALTPRLGSELMPDMAQHEFYFDIELPHGSHISQTDAVLTSLQEQLTDSAIAYSYSIAGIGSLLNPDASQGGDYWGRLQVVLQTDAAADAQQRIQQQLREALQRHPGVSGRIAQPELFSIEQPLVIELSGYDLSQLAQASDQVREALSSHAQFSDIQTTLRPGQPELEVHFDHARLSQVGLTAAEVAELLALQVGGRVATQYNLDDRQIDVRVRLAEQDRTSLEAIENLIINPGAERELPLRAVADITQSTGPGEITRVAQQRVALVSASLSSGDLGQASERIQQMLSELTLPAGVDARLGGQSESQQQAYKSLMLALALAVFLVYLVMASQFESFAHPLLIMFSVPLAAAGSVLGLWLTGTYLSVVVFIGLIMLAGIVVNNAIVLVDRINQLRAQGIARLSAIQQAGEQRLRPIMMTTLTTILGLLPLALGAGEGAEMRSPMAITVIFGLLFASILTLVFIPVLYAIFDRKSFSTGEQYDVSH